VRLEKSLGQDPAPHPFEFVHDIEAGEAEGGQTKLLPENIWRRHTDSTSVIRRHHGHTQCDQSPLLVGPQGTGRTSNREPTKMGSTGGIGRSASN